MQKARTAEELCVHSFALAGSRSRHRRCEVGGRARRRSFCVRCTPFISEASIPAAEGACTHDMLAHHTVLTCVLTSCARRRWKGSGAHIQWISMIGHAVARCSLVVVHAVVQWFASFCCVWRPRSIARSTSHIACIARDVSGWFGVVLEPHGLSLGDPRHRGRTGKVL